MASSLDEYLDPNFGKASAGPSAEDSLAEYLPAGATFTGEVANSFMNNLYSTVGLLYGGPQTIAGYTRGDQEQLQAGLEKIKSWTDSANDQFPAAVTLDNFLEDPSFENGKLYLGNAIGSVASTLPTLLTGAAGGGAAIGLGLARAAGERALAKGLTAVAAKGAENAVIKYAVLAAAAPTAALMNTGETVAGLAEADPNDTHPELALGVGALKTGLDFVGMGGVLNAFLKTGSRGVIEKALVDKFGSRMGNALVGAFGAAGKEGVTEGLQELADVVAQESLKPGSDPDIRKAAIKILDSAFKGAVGGGLGGGAGGLFKPADPAPAPAAQVAAEVQADQGVAKEKPTLPSGPPNVEDASSPGYSPNFTELKVVNSLNEQLAKQYGFAPETVALNAEQDDELRAMLGLPSKAERTVAPEGPQRQPLDPLQPGLQGPDTPQEDVQKWLTGAAAAVPGDGAEIKLLDDKDNNVIPGLRSLVERVLGPENAQRVQFTDRLILPSELQGKFGEATEVRGFTDSFTGVGAMAAVALGIGEPRYTTIHESTHVAERLGLIPANARQVVAFNFPAVQALMAQAAKEGYTDMGAKGSQAALNKGGEPIAYAMESYLFLRDKGKVPGAAGPLRALLEPVYNFFNRVRSYLRGHGFTSFNDVLEAFSSGKYAQKATPVRKTAALYGAPQAAILAWHGSPHTFEKFSTEKIGTGEGAQAYGHGLYFTSSQEIAKHYKEKLSRKNKGNVTFDGASYTARELGYANYDSPEVTAKNYMLAAVDVADGQRQMKEVYADLIRNAVWAKEDIESTQKQFLNKRMPNLAKDRIEQWQELIDNNNRFAARIEAALQWLRDNGERFQFEGKKGRLYKVELAPEEHQLLDWDKPLREQTPYVKNALTAFAMNNSAMYEQMVPHQQIRGKDIYKELSTRIAYKQGDGTYGKAGQPDELASQKLAGYGIKGIKYLAGTSRRKGEGDYNFVIFDDKDVQVQEIQAAVAVREAMAAVPSLKVEDPGKQMMWLERWGNHTTQIADKFPAARPFYQVGREMFQNRHALMQEGQALTQALEDLKGEGTIRVNDLIIESDARNTVASKDGARVVLKDDRGVVIGTLTDPADIKAYYDYHKAGKVFQEGLRKTVLVGLKLPTDTTPSGLRKERAALSLERDAIVKDTTLSAKEKAGQLKTLDEQRDFLQGAADELDDMAARQFYMPHVREGNWGVAVKDKDGETIYYEKFYMPRFAKPRQKFLQETYKRLRAAYPDGEIGAARKDIPGEVGAELLGQVGFVEGLASLFDAKNASEHKEFFNQLRIHLTKRGARQHMQRRKNIPGYVTPANKKDYALIAMHRYMPSVSNYISKALLQPKFDEAMGVITASRDKHLIAWAAKQMEYISSAQEEAGWVRSIAFHAFLGFNISSGLINMTSIVLNTMPFMGQFDVAGNRFVAGAFKDATFALPMKDIVSNHVVTPSKNLTHLDAKQQALVRQWEDSGVIGPIQMKHTEAKLEEQFRRIGWLPRPVNRGLMRLAAVSASPQAVTEMMNRLTTGLAFYRWTQATPGWEAKVRSYWEANRMQGTPLTAESFATHAIEKTQFDMSKLNRPGFTQGAFPAVATQFMSYPLQMVELMANMWSRSGVDARGRMALASMLFGLWVLGGFFAQPGTESLRRLMEALAKLAGRTINLDQMARGWLQQTGLSKKSAEMIMKGPWRNWTGADISGRVAIDPLKLGNLLTDTTGTLVGPGGAAIAGALGSAVKDFNGDKPWKALVDLFPVAAKNVFEGVEAGREGFKDARGRTIVGPESITPLMQGMKAIGFAPTQVSEARERKQFDQAIIDSQKGRTERYVRRVADAQVEMVRARAAGDNERSMAAVQKLQDTLKEMTESNNGKKLADWINVKGVVEAAKKQVVEDTTGGYNSLQRIKGKSLLKKSELFAERQP